MVTFLPQSLAQIQWPGLRVVIRVKILEFPGDFSQACISGQCADHEPPQVVTFLRQVGSEGN